MASDHCAEALFYSAQWSESYLTIETAVTTLQRIYCRQGERGHWCQPPAEAHSADACVVVDGHTGETICLDNHGFAGPAGPVRAGVRRQRNDEVSARGQVYLEPA